MTRNFRLGRGGAPGVIRFRAADLGGGGSDPTPDVAVDFNDATDYASALALPGMLSTDYTYPGTTDGLQLVSISDGPFGPTKVMRSNMPVGAQGFASGGGYATEYGTGANPCQHRKSECYWRPSAGWTTAGSTGTGSRDYKHSFSADGDGYAGAGTLVSTGRGTILKLDNQGIANRGYCYPNTAFDTLFHLFPDDVGDLNGWVRMRSEHRAGGAGNGLWWVELRYPDGSTTVVDEVGYDPSGAYLGYDVHGANLNLFLGVAGSIDRCLHKHWLPGNFPSWGYTA